MHIHIHIYIYIYVPIYIYIYIYITHAIVSMIISIVPCVFFSGGVVLFQRHRYKVFSSHQGAERRSIFVIMCYNILVVCVVVRLIVLNHVYVCLNNINYNMTCKYTTPSPPTNILNSRGSDSSRLLILRGGNSHVRIIL